MTRIRRWLSVKGYGGVGDGAADDTAAVNRAIAALGSSAP